MTTIVFHVQDAAGQPIGGAHLSAVSVAGPWQAVTNPCGDFITPQPGLTPGHYDITISAPGFTDRVLPADLQDSGVITIGLERGVSPILPDVRVWRGAFCIPDAMPCDLRWDDGTPDGRLFGDGKRIWTPAYGSYPDAQRAELLRRYTQRPYTHFVYNCASPDGVYHNDYPAMADDPARARRDLLEIRAAGLVPVVAACNDANGGSVVPYRAFTENADLIPVYFPMWEMNGPLGVDVMQGGASIGRVGDCIRNCRAAAPHADWYPHFTAGHGAGAEPEGEWWQWAASLGCVGLLSQDDGYTRRPDGDPVGTAAGLADTARHLRGEVSGWEGLHLLNVAFEQITTPLYHDGWTEATQLAYGARLMAILAGVSNVAGFCDGAQV